LLPLEIVVLCPSWAYFAGGMCIYTNQAIKQSGLHCCLLVVFSYILTLDVDLKIL